jgi:hypothetical protein
MGHSLSRHCRPHPRRARGLHAPRPAAGPPQRGSAAREDKRSLRILIFPLSNRACGGPARPRKSRNGGRSLSSPFALPPPQPPGHRRSRRGRRARPRAGPPAARPPPALHRATSRSTRRSLRPFRLVRATVTRAIVGDFRRLFRPRPGALDASQTPSASAASQGRDSQAADKTHVRVARGPTPVTPPASAPLPAAARPRGQARSRAAADQPDGIP